LGLEACGGGAGGADTSAGAGEFVLPPQEISDDALKPIRAVYVMFLIGFSPMFLGI